MSNEKSFIKILAVVALVLTVTMACGFFPNFGNIRSQVREQVKETAESVATEAVGDIQLTASAIGAEIGPEIQATLLALPSQVDIGKAPADVPVIPNPSGFFGSENQVIYMTTDTLDKAVNFYRQEMPANGWQETEPSLVVSKVAYLNFENANQKAIVTMVPSADKLAITILISQK
jgi:hypothetical protein